MYHLLDNPTWQWYCKKTKDLFRYENCTLDMSFIRNHYMAYESAPDVIDYNQYSSARDCTYFSIKMSTVTVALAWAIEKMVRSVKYLVTYF